jgi:hypothetical protein
LARRPWSSLLASVENDCSKALTAIDFVSR